MQEERFWLLVSLKFSGEANAEELQELNNILKQHPELSAYPEMLMNLWKENKTETDTHKNLSFQNHLKRLNNQIPDEEVKQTDNIDRQFNNTVKPGLRFKLLWWASGIAASFLIIFSIFNQRNSKASPEHVAKNIVTTKAGSKSNIQLPDGSQVWLNADSKISYPEKFLGKFREVSLSGEAYFDVVKDPSRPFIIHTNELDVKVLGTAFNVRSYPNETTTETALIRGSVQIILHNDPDRPIFLKPNDKVIINNNVPDIANKVDSAAQIKENEKPWLTMGKIHIDTTEKTATETLWVKNKLAFEDESLERTLAEIERWYNVTITANLDNDQLKLMHFSGTFPAKPLADVIDALCFAEHLHYKIKDTSVTIW